ncbi:MAG: hypothetical protein GWN87_07155, partial [Desulfuromonadales bacterium]|nr:hypothetical protein [Desulfuromonadales bacterium]
MGPTPANSSPSSASAPSNSTSAPSIAAFRNRDRWFRRR